MDEQFELGADGLCPRCSMLGRSRFFSRLLPGYSTDPVLVSRFTCEDEECGAVIDTAQLAGRCSPRGVRLSLVVAKGDAAALGRTLLKADTATISIPELEFEISPDANTPFQGDLTTVSGCLRSACATLSSDQEQRHAADHDTASKIDAFIQELLQHAAGEHTFTLVVDDPAGNSYIGGPPESVGAGAGAGDTLLTVERYVRSAADAQRLGLDAEEDAAAGAAAAAAAEVGAGAGGREAAAAVPQGPFLRVKGYPAQQLVARFGEGGAPAAAEEVPCPDCSAAVAARVHVPPPPFIPASRLLDLACPSCGQRFAELRSCSSSNSSSSSGSSSDGAAPRGGIRLVLSVEAAEDLDRVVLASTSASLVVPELGLALAGGADGVFSSVRDLLQNVLGGLAATRGMLPAEGVDAEASEAQREWEQFADEMADMLQLRRPWSLQLTDPAGRSFISRPAGEPEADGRLRIQRIGATSEPPAARGPAGSAA